MSTPKNTPAVFWFTGLSGAGKTTLAMRLFHELQEKGHRVELLDGDVIRNRTPSIGFLRADRIKHLNNAADIAAEFEAKGFTVVASFITPYEEARTAIRNRLKNYIEIHVETPLSVCESRDPKGLYKRARSGELQNFTGISAEFETPLKSDIRIDTSNDAIDGSFEKLKAEIRKKFPKIFLSL